MIARLDDTAKLRVDTFAASALSKDFAITTALVWSKNVLTEDDCPQQILLGANDPKYCALLGLATWMEYILGRESDRKTFVFEVDTSLTPELIKLRASRYLNEIITSDEFTTSITEYVDGPLGSHSIRKYATTFARRSGSMQNDVDYR